jgi:hypothetical protein
VDAETGDAPEDGIERFAAVFPLRLNVKKRIIRNDVGESFEPVGWLKQRNVLWIGHDCIIVLLFTLEIDVAPDVNPTGAFF